MKPINNIPCLTGTNKQTLKQTNAKTAVVMTFIDYNSKKWINRAMWKKD